MKVVVIGGTGHIGTYLVPRLVRAGHEVVSVSRGERDPYQSRREWASVEQVHLDRSEAEVDGTFGTQLAALGAEVVVDLICFDLESCVRLRDALEGNVQHFLHCGTIWVHGPAEVVPTTEDAQRRPSGEYGVQKARIEAYLLRQARLHGFPATILHPGHIVGPGWVPINPQGNLAVGVFERLANGESVSLPDRGLETLHHVHADDVAQAFERAMTHRSVSIGESFHVVSPQAVTLLGYAREVAGWYGREADIELLPWKAWRATVAQEDAAATLEHIGRSPNASIAKARRLLEYAPRYTTFQAVRESVDWLAANGRIAVRTGRMERHPRDDLRESKG